MWLPGYTAHQPSFYNRWRGFEGYHMPSKFVSWVRWSLRTHEQTAVQASLNQPRFSVLSLLGKALWGEFCSKTFPMWNNTMSLWLHHVDNMLLYMGAQGPSFLFWWVTVKVLDCFRVHWKVIQSSTASLSSLKGISANSYVILFL